MATPISRCASLIFAPSSIPSVLATSRIELSYCLKSSVLQMLPSVKSAIAPFISSPLKLVPRRPRTRLDTVELVALFLAGQARLVVCHQPRRDRPANLGHHAGL